MKFLQSIPICSNGLFIYKLDIKDDLDLKFKDEKFKDEKFMSRYGKFEAGMGEDMNVLRKYENLNQEINKAVDETLEKILMLQNGLNQKKQKEKRQETGELIYLLTAPLLHLFLKKTTNFP